MKKRSIIITIVLIVIVLLAGFIAYEKLEKSKKEYQVEKVSEYNYFVVKENDKYGVIDANGNKIIETNYDNVVIPNPNKAVFVCYSGDKTEVFNDKKENLFQKSRKIKVFFDNGLGICLVKDLYMDRPAAKVSNYFLNFVKDLST